jgi:hypothetical protein
MLKEFPSHGVEIEASLRKQIAVAMKAPRSIKTSVASLTFSSTTKGELIWRTVKLHCLVLSNVTFIG